MKAILFFISLCVGFVFNCQSAFANEADDFNLPPVAIFSMAPSSGDYPLTVSFNGAASYDPDGPFINHFWNFGDGTTGFGATTNHTYTTAGTFIVTLLVTDIFGAASSVTKTVTVTAPEGIYTIAINPIEDAFLQVGTRQNISSIEVSATKDAYLMFDLSGIVGDVIDANLRLSYEGLTSVTGRVTVWEGSHNSWSETNLSDANRPFPVQVVGERDSIFDFAYYEWDISGVEAGNTYSYVLLGNEDNFVFGSSEFFSADGRPELFLTVDNSTPRIEPPSVSITTPTNNAIVGPGSNILFEAAASDNGSVAEVAFYRGNILLGTDNTAPYTYTVTGTTLGDVYNVKAIATDDEGYTTSSDMVHVEVGSNEPPIILITSPTDGTAYTTGDDVMITASASDNDGFIVKVEFYDGAIKLGEDNTIPYEWTIGNISVGTHAITARAYDSGGSNTVSDVVNININNACGANAVAELGFDSNSGSGLIAENDGGTDGFLRGGASKIATSTGGNVLLLSSAGDYVEVPHYADIGFTENVTLTGWVNVNQIIGDAGIIVKGETARAYGLRLSSAGALNFDVPGGGSWMSSTTLDLNRWYHVAVTYDGSNVRFYIDGVLDANEPAAIINFPSNAEPLTIGADLVNTDKYFDGLIDGSQVYCRALNATEIVTLSSESAPNILPSVAVVTPQDGDVYSLGDDIIIKTNPEDLDGTVDKVEFFVNGSKVGEALAAPYEFTYASPPAGNYTVVVRAIDNAGGLVNESVTNVTVQAGSFTLEAECAQIGGNMGIRNSTIASNGQFVVYPGIGKTFVAPPSSNSDLVRFSFVSQTVGTYEVHVRLQAGNSFNDSFWVRYNNGTWMLFDNIPKSIGFKWVKLYDTNDNDNTVVLYLNAGLNFIDFAAREDGTKIDKVSFKVAGSALPTGMGENAMNCPTNLANGDNGIDTTDADWLSWDDEETQQELEIAPNPASGDIVVRFGNILQVDAVQLLNSNGTVMARTTPERYATNIRFTRPSSSSGLYFVRIFTPEGVITRSVMYTP